ncbi:cytochrome c oxidase assembly protein [Phenylobacterium sp.]|uniref:cytochrome c oxidase assembly protein n=1 Tax=Phenylobacterium sp. TaxID=1871053 RepID=UPI0025D6A550|nr:cytochrome c oxidase assembly protein [Phenylobacterium sp.]
MTGSDRLPTPPDPAARRNARVALICGVAIVAVVGAAYASVPLYRAYCQATGFDGATVRAQVAPDKTLARTVTVRFDANVNGLPWTFWAEQGAQSVKIGETKLAFFKVTNHANKPVTARAVYNVVPEQAGAYFQKLQCFCFNEQTIPAGATVEMPVLYFIDPKFTEDVNTKGATEVTLSYTFYPSVNGAKQAQAAPPKPKG